MRIKFEALPCFLVILFLINQIYVVSGLCLKDQRSLLLQLKSEFNYNHSSSTKLANWNESIGCCEWSGITCDDEGHVSGLDLSGKQIFKGFANSSSLFSLIYLQYLNLANNGLYSKIPFGFNKLKNLTYLNLSNTFIRRQVIPSEEISHLTRLVTLDLSTITYIFQLSLTSLGDLVKNFANIRQLYLDGVFISTGGKEWNSALLQIPTLQELSMSDCDIFGALESSLTRLENPSLVRLDYNYFSSPVPKTFANFKNLTTLSLAYCGLTGIFSQKIFQIPTLTLVDISSNYHLNGFFPDFSLNAYLQHLIVSCTNFSGRLSNSVGNLRNLTILDLSHSRFNGTLPNALSNLTQLVKLDFSTNNFGGSIPSLTLCTKLEIVYLFGNHFTGEISATHFAGLPNLFELNLDDNSFTGVIPFYIFMLPSLKTIELSKNEFRGNLNEFRNVSSSIQKIDLSHNYLEGHIPMSLFQIPTLAQLDLSSNKFNGTLDLHMVSQLRNLDTLDLSSNKLSGTLLDLHMFSKLRNLRILDLSFNKLSGTIDLHMVSKLRNLDTLDLSNNNLSLIDTTTFKSNTLNFPKVSRVRLASCNLTTFPYFLKNQSRLFELNLSNNHIAGMIPEWIWNRQSLNLLNLSHNYLTNWEEPLLINSSSLEYVDLHSNL